MSTYQPDQATQTLRENCDRLVKKHGLTYQEVAERAGMSRQLLHYLMKSSRTMSLDHASRLATALHTTVRNLLKKHSYTPS